MAKPLPFNFAHAVRDIFVAAINKGQLALLGCIGLAGLIIWKMSTEAVDKLAASIFHSLENRFLVGYVLWLLTLGLWFWQQKASRKRESNEMARGSNEKTDLQNKLSGGKFKSSEEP